MDRFLVSGFWFLVEKQVSIVEITRIPKPETKPTTVFMGLSWPILTSHTCAVQQRRDHAHWRLHIAPVHRFLRAAFSSERCQSSLINLTD